MHSYIVLSKSILDEVSVKNTGRQFSLIVS